MVVCDIFCLSLTLLIAYVKDLLGLSDPKEDIWKKIHKFEH